MNQTKKLFHSIQGIAMTEMSIKKNKSGRKSSYSVCVRMNCKHFLRSLLRTTKLTIAQLAHLYGPLLLSL